MSAPSEAEASIVWAPLQPNAVARVGVRGHDEIVVDWPGVGRLFASRAGGPHRFVPAADIPPEWIEKFEKTHLAGCLRYLARDLSLHGAAVRLGDAAVALVGDSGAGKSTLAACLAQLGAELVADDLVALEWVGETPTVSPNADAVWLLGDAARHFSLGPDRQGAKIRHPLDPAGAPVPLRGVVELAFDEDLQVPRLAQLVGVEAFAALSRAHVCYVAEPAAEAPDHLRSRARLAASTPLFRLQRPRNLHLLAASASLVADLLLRPSSGPCTP